MKKIFCFDFDGTIADTLPLIIGVADVLFKKMEGRELSGDFLRKIRKEGIEEVFREAKIPSYKLFFLYLKIKKKMNKGVASIAVDKEMERVLKELKNKGHVVGILTSNSNENVIDFLNHNDLDFFDFVKTSGVLGKGREIKKLKQQGRDFFYIGDEVRDIKAGKKANVKTVAVPWGLSSRKALQKARPDVLIERPGDLLDFSL